MRWGTHSRSCCLRTETELSDHRTAHEVNPEGLLPKCRDSGAKQRIFQLTTSQAPWLVENNDRRERWVRRPLSPIKQCIPSGITTGRPGDGCHTPHPRWQQFRYSAATTRRDGQRPPARDTVSGAEDTAGSEGLDPSGPTHVCQVDPALPRGRLHLRERPPPLRPPSLRRLGPALTAAEPPPQSFSSTSTHKRRRRAQPRRAAPLMLHQRPRLR